MSLINDALKRAKQASSSEAPPPEPLSSTSLQPVAHNPVPVAGWLIPAIVISLIVAGVFFVGFALARHSTNGGGTTPVSSPAPAVASAPAPTATPAEPVPPAAPPAQPVAPPVVVPVAKPAPAVQAEVRPKLQGIFYSPTAPAAIVDGKTVRPGDPLSQYHVVEITKLTVTLKDADGKMLKLSLDN